jgi:hypothetical protein
MAASRATSCRGRRTTLLRVQTAVFASDSSIRPEPGICTQLNTTDYYMQGGGLSMNMANQQQSTCWRMVQVQVQVQVQ